MISQCLFCFMVGWAGKRSCTREVTWPRPCSLFAPVFSLTPSVDCQARAVSAEGRRSPRLVCTYLRRTSPLSIGQHNKTNHILHLLLTVFTQGCFCLCKINCCSVAQLCLTLCNPWTAACQTSLSFTISWSLLKLTSIGSVMTSNYLILCCPLLLPSVFPSIRVFSNESALHIRWPNYWSFSFSISPSNE